MKKIVSLFILSFCLSIYSSNNHTFKNGDFIIFLNNLISTCNAGPISSEQVNSFKQQAIELFCTSRRLNCPGQPTFICHVSSDTPTGSSNINLENYIGNFIQAMNVIYANNEPIIFCGKEIVYSKNIELSNSLINMARHHLQTIVNELRSLDQ